MTDAPKPGPASPPAASWIGRLGRRNLAYLLFVALLIPLGIALEASGPRGPDSGGGIMLALMLFGAGSALFFLANAALAIVALAKRRPAGKALIGCALPFVVIIGALLLEELTVR